MNRDTGSREDKLFMGVTPLMIAVLKEKAGAISVLLSEGADLEERDDEGHTALILATLTLKEEIISQLIKAGAKIDAKDHKGATPLWYAISWNPNSEIVQVLLDNGAKPIEVIGNEPESTSIKRPTSMRYVHDIKKAPLLLSNYRLEPQDSDLKVDFELEPEFDQDFELDQELFISAPGRENMKLNYLEDPKIVKELVRLSRESERVSNKKKELQREGFRLRDEQNKLKEEQETLDRNRKDLLKKISDH